MVKDREQWAGFQGVHWRYEVNVRDFIQNNYTPYDGDESFLQGPTAATEELWGKLQELQKEEREKGGVLDMETEVVSGITAYGAAYMNDLFIRRRNLRLLIPVWQQETGLLMKIESGCDQ